MKAIILAAGYAVRLQPLTIDMPKSLLSVGNKIIVDRIIDKIAAVRGAGQVTIVTNDRFYRKFAAWLAGSKHRDRAVIINDLTASNETRLGAIKDIELALTRTGMDDDILIIAGDNLFDFDLNRFVEFARSNSDGVSVALYDVKEPALASAYGIVKVDKAARVIDFQEKPPRPQSTLASTGIYYFPKNKLPFIKEYVKMQTKLDAPGYYIGWLSKREKVYGFTFTEDWYDIGSIESYKKADSDYLKKERRKDV